MKASLRVLALRVFVPPTCTVHTLLSGALLACAFTAAPALAGLDIRAMSTTPTVTVIDLNPADDREAGFEILGWTTDLQARLDTDRFHVSDRQRPVAGVPAMAGVGEGAQALTASTLGPFAALDTRIRPAPYGGLQVPSVDARQNAYVLLQPYSQLIVHGNSVLTARWEPQQGTQYIVSRGWFNAALYEQFPEESRSAFSNVELNSSMPGEPQFTSRDVDYTLTFSNYGADAVSLRLDMSAGAWATVSAVPEPHALAMLAAGLCVLGQRLRRRCGLATGRPARRHVGGRPLVAALLACISLPPLAHADGIRSTLDLSGLTLDAIDLRPADGIGASVDVYHSQTTLTATFRDANHDDMYVKQPMSGLPSDVYLGTPVTWTALHADGTLGDFTVEMAGDAAAAWHIVTAQTEQQATLLVSPYTRLAVSGHIAMSAAWEGPPSRAYTYDGWVDIHLEQYRWRDGLYRNFHLEGQEFPGSKVLDDDYVLQLVNDTAEPMYFQLHAVSRSTTYLYQVAAVPEPSGLTMTAVGLALCGMAAVRRRRNVARGKHETDEPSAAISALVEKELS